MVKRLLPRQITDAPFQERLAALRTKGAPAIDRAELERVVAGVVGSLSGGMRLADLELYNEIEALSDYIRSARREIAGLRPSEIRDRHIPMATDELDAVVEATAEATGVVLSGIETIEGLVPRMPADMAPTVQDIVVKIYEACGFQDITGQRITKVVGTLKHIESRIDAILAVFGAHGAEEAPAEDAKPEGDAGLLNGPALPTAAATQADIDAILASFD
jgi:chemotaxis protein CheZ